MPLQEEIDWEWALKKFKPPFEPRCVFLFSGHRIDAPGRPEPRFPADKEKIAAEANAAKERGILIPVLLDSLEPPLGFRRIHAADLTNWKPRSSSSSFDQLIQVIASVVGV